MDQIIHVIGWIGLIAIGFLAFRLLGGLVGFWLSKPNCPKCGKPMRREPIFKVEKSEDQHKQYIVQCEFSCQSCSYKSNRDGPEGFAFVYTRELSPNQE